MMQHRTKAGLTQKELATTCNAKASLVQDYESGKAVPTVAFLQKVERAIRQKDPSFVLGTLTKAQKTAADDAKKKAAAKAKKAKAAGGGARAQTGPVARSRRF